MKGKKHEYEEHDKDAAASPAQEKPADVRPQPEIPIPAGAQAAAEDVQALRDKAQKADAFYDNYLRVAAELENYRKRAQKDRHSAVEAAQVQILRGLLPIVDNLDRALAQIGGQSDIKSVRDGLDLIAKQVQTFLESVGLKTFSSVGETFDPHKHEAVLHVQSKEHPDHTVLEEVQKGYTLHGRVVRHALVKVVDNPSAPAEPSAPPENNEKEKKE